jgi:hypothetical protein
MPFMGLIVHIATLVMGLRPRQGLARVRAKKGNSKVTSHALKSVGECEGMNPHTPKRAPTTAPILGVGVSMDS